VRGVVFDGIGAVRVDHLPDPAIEEPGDVVVEVTLTAVCGSDLHAYHGKLPMVPGESLGHEGVGVVREVGPSVRSFSPGDRVVLPFGICCGECWYCRSGATSLCAQWRYLGFGDYGGGLAGTQAERVRVPLADANLLAIPDDVDDERALFAGDVATTGHYGARMLDPRPGESVAVVGAGPVGFFAAQALHSMGVGTVLLLDREESRLQLAPHAGAIPVHVGEDVDVSKAVKEYTEGRGADAAIDAVGLIPAYETTLRATRRGGRVCVLGVYGPEERIEVHMGAYWVRQLRLLFAGVCPVQSSWQATMELLRSGAIDPGRLVSHRLPLEEAAAAYDLFDRREATKVLLRP
jgi:2-desacetyl-2-hydroxyethyl bacteriochlorophyllide A dehydrogenase